MLNNLPNEILINILSLLDIKELENINIVNKYVNLFSTSDYLYRIKCIKEYKKRSKPIIWDNWKQYYIYLLNTLCINCQCKTKDVHPFYNKKICIKCNNSEAYYRTINFSNVQKNYGLTSKDLKGLRVVKKSKYSSKLYLEKEIMKIYKNKYKTEEEFLKKMYIKHYNKLHKREIKYNNEIQIVRECISIGIDYNLVCDYLNRYSNNEYNIYIRSGNGFEKIVKYCLELYYCKYFTVFYVNYINESNFELILFYSLIDIYSHQEYNIKKMYLEIYSKYFNKDLTTIFTKYKNNFTRRNMVVYYLKKYYNSYFLDYNRIILQFPLTSSYIYMYITGLYPDYPLNEIIEEDIIIEFLSTNTIYLLYKESLQNKETEYNIRKLAYSSYKEITNGEIQNETLKRVLDNYFNSNN